MTSKKSKAEKKELGLKQKRQKKQLLKKKQRRKEAEPGPKRKKNKKAATPQLGDGQPKLPGGKRGKRLRREAKAALQAEAASTGQPHQQPPPPKAGSCDGAEKQSRSTISLVPAETAKYLTEVVAHFKTLTDDEQRALLVANVLEEVAGREQQVAGDPTCSRHIEELLAAAAPPQLLGFMTAIMASGGLSQMASSPFGSHVAEKLLMQLDESHDGLSTQDYEALCQLLEAVTAEMCGALWQFITDRFATHVARRVLCLLCGANIMPSGARGPSAAAAPAMGEEGEEGSQAEGGAQRARPAKGVAPSGLASKLAPPTTAVNGAQPAAHAAACRFPAHVEAVLRVLTREDYTGESMAELVRGRYSSPFLQAALRAATTLPHSRNALAALVPAILGATYIIEGSQKQGRILEGVAADHVQSLAEDTAGSRVLEVVAAVSGGVPGLVDELVARFFTARLRPAAQHPTSNFVVQAVLAACSSADQVKAIFEELSPVIGELLQRRRAGVVAALVAACARTGCCHKEMCAALSAVLTASPPWAGQPASKVLAYALLSLDCGAPPFPTGEASALPDIASLCGPGARGVPRMSTIGSAILISVLQYPQGSCRDFTDSLVNMPPADLARVARDAAGARALENLIDGTAPTKVKQRLLAGLQGGWAVAASSGSGSFLVEKCYSHGDMTVKEAIVSELVAAERHLLGLRWGYKLLARVGAEAFKRGAEQWRQSVASSSKAAAGFAELFGAGEGQNGAAPSPANTEHKPSKASKGGGKGGAVLPAAGVSGGSDAEAEAASLVDHLLHQGEKGRKKRSRVKAEGGEGGQHTAPSTATHKEQSPRQDDPPVGSGDQEPKPEREARKDEGRKQKVKKAKRQDG